MSIIDFHTHIGGGFTIPNIKGVYEVRAEHLIEYMDEVGVEKAVLLSVGEYWRNYEKLTGLTNELTLEAASKYPDRIIPFMAVDPGPDAEKKIRELYSKGFKGFGEYKVDLKFDDPRSIEIFKVCGELGLPVLTHNDPHLHFSDDIDAIERTLGICSDTIFIFHGPSWWREISGKVDYSVGYPSGKVVPGGKVCRILKEYSNAYADISAGSGYNALNRDREFAKTFLEENADKILLGTDFPCLDGRGGQYGPNKLHLKLLQSLELDKKVYRKIVYENALKILKL
ncbi:amidohydrolase family protein [Candidatus Bathyarchaeota archaeon]|nr:amidohydrolase family protein [Candidatus Bathyarchaeota archaeon]